MTEESEELGTDVPEAKNSSHRQSNTATLNAVGIFGEVLLTAGAVVLLFLAWQLWWNDALLANSQSNAAADASVTWMSDADPADHETASASAAPVAPVDFGTPSVITNEPSEGEAFAIMYVPRFGSGTQRQIAQGVGTDVLNSTRLGVGHYTDTAMPGGEGNFAIAAHRSAYGGGMHLVNELQVGDPIYIQTKDGWYTYKFRNFEFVRASAIGVLDAVPQGVGEETGQRLITLTTCNPVYSTEERIIAYGILESWQPSSAGVPVEIASEVESWKKK